MEPEELLNLRLRKPHLSRIDKESTEVRYYHQAMGAFVTDPY